MLANTNLAFGCFINLFLIPIIGLKIYCNRHNITPTFTNIKILYLYTLITVLNYPFARLFIIILQKFFPLTIYVEESKYTVLALISCTLLVFFIEIIEKFLCIEVLISLRPSTKSDQKAKTSEGKNES